MDPTRADAESSSHSQLVAASTDKVEKVEMALASCAQWKSTRELLNPLLQKIKEDLKATNGQFLFLVV